jgi:hypothetical protein
MKEHCVAEMKIYFGEHEMGKYETFEELERIGFITCRIPVEFSDFPSQKILSTIHFVRV